MIRQPTRAEIAALDARARGATPAQIAAAKEKELKKAAAKAAARIQAAKQYRPTTAKIRELDAGNDPRKKWLAAVKTKMENDRRWVQGAYSLPGSDWSMRGGPGPNFDPRAAAAARDKRLQGMIDIYGNDMVEAWKPKAAKDTGFLDRLKTDVGKAAENTRQVAENVVDAGIDMVGNISKIPVDLFVKNVVEPNFGPGIRRSQKKNRKAAEKVAETVTEHIGSGTLPVEAPEYTPPGSPADTTPEKDDDDPTTTGEAESILRNRLAAMWRKNRKSGRRSTIRTNRNLGTARLSRRKLTAGA